MQFQNAVRNEYHKCDLPENTLASIKAGFEKLGYPPTYSSVRVTDRLFWGRIWINNLHIQCEGKGLSPLLAETSAHAELAERFSAGLYYPAFEEEVRFHLPAIYSSQTRDFLNYTWMSGYISAVQDELERPLKIEDLLAKQTHLDKKNLKEIKYSEMASHWVDGYSLLQEQTVKVPLKFAAYIQGSNGIAAGNTLEEAMLQASCEVLERRAQIYSIKNESIVPSIDPTTINTPVVQEMIDFYEHSGVEVTIKDLSANGILPVIGVLFTNRNLSPEIMEHYTLIAGASFDLEEALTRCFMEGVQGKKDLRAPRKAFNQPFLTRSSVKDYYSVMKCGVSPKDISFLRQGDTVAFQNAPRKDISEEIAELKRLVQNLGTDCILLDHTHPILQFPVVRVIIPGLSDFLDFLPPRILSDANTSPVTAWKGEEYKKVMRTFFRS